LRGVPRWIAALAVLTVVAGVCAFTLHRALVPAQLIAQLSASELPADGFSSTQLTIRSSNGRELRGLQIYAENRHQLLVDSPAINANFATATLQSGVMPGVAKLRVTAAGFAPQEVTLRTTPDYGDAIGDGTPDFLRLHDAADRLAFRHWFTLLAESQLYLHPNAPTAGAPGTPNRGPNAAPEIDDCAALLRFAYREALREHDAAWAHAMALPAPATSGDIQQYQYPYTPLGAAIFRVHGGSFAADDLHDATFAEFADAATLWRRNTFFVGRNLSRARPGDLLFFRQDAARMPFHAMIFLGRSQVEPGSEEFVVYHTGPTLLRANVGRAGERGANGDFKGQIKRLSVADLLNYPDARWRPIASNPAFLGVYRWNILRGGE
jgi:uncharacterized protein YfaT (DUF1175 family)